MGRGGRDSYLWCDILAQVAADIRQNGLSSVPPIVLWRYMSCCHSVVARQDSILASFFLQEHLVYAFEVSKVVAEVDFVHLFSGTCPQSHRSRAFAGCSHVGSLALPVRLARHFPRWDAPSSFAGALSPALAPAA